MTELETAIQDLLQKQGVCAEARQLIKAALRTQGGSTGLADEVKALTLPAVTPTSKRLLARELYASGRGYKSIARLLSLYRTTVRRWKVEEGWTRIVPPLAQGNVPPATMLQSGHNPTSAWMQSLHHESAHLIVNGQAACTSGVKGAKVDAGMRWFPWNGCLRKCSRCLGAQA